MVLLSGDDLVYWSVAKGELELMGVTEKVLSGVLWADDDFSGSLCGNMSGSTHRAAAPAQVQVHTDCIMHRCCYRVKDNQDS